MWLFSLISVFIGGGLYAASRLSFETQRLPKAHANLGLLTAIVAVLSFSAEIVAHVQGEQVRVTRLFLFKHFLNLFVLWFLGWVLWLLFFFFFF